MVTDKHKDQVHRSMGKISPIGIYEHLGMFDSNVSDTTKMKALLQQEILRRCWNVLQTQLNPSNTVKEFNMLLLFIRIHIALFWGFLIT